MAMAQTKVTAQDSALGEESGQLIVGVPVSYSSEDIQRVLFGERPVEPHSLDELKEGVRNYVRTRHARR